MRTTIELSDEAYHFAKAVAHDRKESLGKAMSELILRAANPQTGNIGEMRIVDGWPVVHVGRVVTSEDVRQFLEDSE